MAAPGSDRASQIHQLSLIRSLSALFLFLASRV